MSGNLSASRKELSIDRVLTLKGKDTCKQRPIDDFSDNLVASSLPQITAWAYKFYGKNNIKLIRKPVKI